MADKVSSEEVKGEHEDASADHAQNILENVFMFNGVQLEVTFSKRGLSWKHKDKPQYISTQSIVGAKIGDGKSTNANPLIFTVFHIEVQPTLIWKLRKTTFKSEREAECDTWVEKIKLIVKEEVPARPKRLLVFVNPCGGRQKGEQLYRKTVAPIFETAEIKVDLILTKDGDHAPSVIEKYDLETIDGIVSMGGDGTFAKILNALVKRTMNEAGKDLSKMDEEYVQPKVPLAYLPGGTGNGCVKFWFKTMELETCALHIISGKSFEIETCAFYNNNKPAMYCALGLAFGVMAAQAVKMEERRHLGLLRVVPALVSFLKKLSTLEVNIKYLTEDNPKLEGGSAEWESIDGVYGHIDGFMGYMTRKNINIGKTHLHLLKGTSGWNLMKYMYRLNKPEDENGLDLDFLDTYTVSAFKITLKNFATDASNEYVWYDGETIHLENPEVICKIQKNAVKILGRSYIDHEERTEVVESLRSKKT